MEYPLLTSYDIREVFVRIYAIKGSTYQYGIYLPDGYVCYII